MFDDLLPGAKRRLGRAGLALGDDLHALESRLAPDERIEQHVRGHDDDERLLWAATPRRLFLVEREMFERDVRELAYGDVRLVERRPAPRGTALVLRTVRKTYVIEGVDDLHADAFIAYVRARLAPLEMVGAAGSLPRTMEARGGGTPALTRAERVSPAIRGLA
ncbi:MAG: hypothetical protein IBJ19_00760, partial [Gemmatimonadaceae bacterium]|nr:hypothetical protein [Gemmatimonadaceae bacterium]